MNKSILDKVMLGFKKNDDQIVCLFDNDMSFEIGSAAIKDNMFFVGDQDIEDSIENDVWLNILNEFYIDILDFTVEDIERWKNTVVKKSKCNSNQKYYSVLKSGIRNKCIAEDIDYDTLIKLPSKGIESAELLLKHISHIDKIPTKIKEAFNKLKE
jgi:hypothetical protein